jgi:protein SCO1/2
MNRRELLALAADDSTARSNARARDAIRRHHFPDIVLRTHQGRTVRFYQDLIRDRIVTINFMYLGCGDGTCPISTHNLARVQKILGDRVGRDIFMYSITLNPEYDTPELLAGYARHFAIGPGWLFLQASPQDTELLRRKLGFYDRNPEIDADKANHAAMVRYGNEPRTLWSSTRALLDPQVTARSILWVA